MHNRFALSLSVTAFADDNAASMTRAEVTQEVIKNMGLAAQAEASAKDASAFKDVAEGSKFEGAINLAYSKGIVNGVIICEGGDGETERENKCQDQGRCFQRQSFHTNSPSFDIGRHAHAALPP